MRKRPTGPDPDIPGSHQAWEISGQQPWDAAGQPVWGSHTVGPPAAYPPGQPVTALAPQSRRSGKVGVLLFAGIGGVLALALLGTLLVVLAGQDRNTAAFEDPETRRARVASTDLSAAAAAFSLNQGVRYTGTFLDAGGDEVAVDARLTNQGWTRATLTADGHKIGLLSNGPRTYLKAGKAYWDSHGAPPDSLAEYAKRWVRVPAEELGVDLARAFAPAALGTDLALAVERGEVSGGTITTLGGLEVREVVTPRAVVYVTTKQPQRIVRVTSHRAEPTPSPSGRGGGEIVPARTPGDPDTFAFDVTGLEPDEVTNLFDELEKRINELKSSVDSQVTFSLDGGITLKPCTVNGCTANLAMSNSVSSDSAYLVVKKSVTATITIRMTLDGRAVKVCRKTRTMKPNGTASVRCRATYVVPRDGRTHHVEAVASAIAHATVEADIKRMFDDLKAERQRGRPEPPGRDADLGSKWQPCHPRTIPDSGECRQVAAKIIKRIGGKQYTIKPKPPAVYLPQYRGYDPHWGEHVVVVKNGRVYDAWTGRYGEPVELYKSRWQWPDAIDFGF